MANLASCNSDLNVRMADDIIRWWQAKKIENSAQLELALNGHVIKLAYHSAKIENNNVTYNDTREIFERDGVVNYTGDLRTLFELRNAKDASRLFLDSFEGKNKLSHQLIKEFQRELVKNTYDGRRWQLGERPGEYKRHDYVTGRNEVGAAPEDVHEEMDEVLEELSAVGKDKILIAAAYFHAKFENIHPFADGNGRAGRLLMNYFLVTHDYPAIIVHEEDRKEYFAALEAWDTSQDLDEMIMFLKWQLVKTWENAYMKGRK